MKTGRLRFIDGLRGVAALMVVAYHLVGRTPWAWVARRGYLGVAIFFVLSGFVIASVIGTDRRITIGYIGRFAARRAVRLDIPYWISIAIAIPVTIAMGRHVGGAQIFSHLFYLQDILGFEDLSPIYWTLCFEIQFYLTLLLIMWLANGVSQRVFSLVVLSMILFSALENAGFMGIPRGAMFGYWWAFSLGAATFWTITKKISVKVLIAALIIVLAMPSAAHIDSRITGVLTAAAIFVASFGAMNLWLSDRVSQFFGRISYSLYLFHPVFGWFVQSIVARHAGPLVALVAGITASIGSAWVFCVLIERRAVELSHRIELSKTSPRALVGNALT